MCAEMLDFKKSLLAYRWDSRNVAVSLGQFLKVK